MEMNRYFLRFVVTVQGSCPGLGLYLLTLRMHANVKCTVKIENFQYIYFDIFLSFAPCQGGSKEYPQSIFWIINKKIRFTPAVLLYKSAV